MPSNFSNRFNGYSVYEVEKSYKHYSKEKKYLISSRIDCILVSPEFDFVLIDFKNTQSAVPSNKYISDDESEVPDFQTSRITSQARPDVPYKHNKHP